MKTKNLRKIVLTIGLCLLLVGLSPLQRSGLANGSEIDFKAIDDYISTQMRASRIPGLTLSIVKGDQVVYLKGYGRADPSGRAVTPQTSFAIESLTKSFTALAVMQLVEAGKIQLDVPVQQYLPWFRVADPVASAHITVRHLLNQTSSLPFVASSETMTWYDQDDMAIERHVRYLENVELNRPVGQSFAYVNANYNVLGMIVQSVSGQSYEEYVIEHIFTPLEMHSSFVSKDEAILHGMAMGYQWLLGFPISSEVPWARGELPAGGIISSAEDMAQYMIAQLNGGRYREVALLSPEGIDLMHDQPVPNTYAMGWYSEQLDSRRIIFSEGGYTHFQSMVIMDPEEKVGVFVAINVMNFLDGTFKKPPTSAVTAESILSLVTNRPLPEQGIGIAQYNLKASLIMLVLTIATIISLVRIPIRYRRLVKRGMMSLSDIAWRTGLTLFVNCVWSAAILWATLFLTGWDILIALSPDIFYWLDTVAAINFLQGLFEVALLWRAYRLTHQRLILQPA